MKQLWNKQHQYLPVLNDYKRDTEARSLTIDETKKELDDRADYVLSYKIDGEENLLVIDNGEVEFLSREGRVRTDMPLTREALSLVSGKGKVIAIGELHVVSPGGQPIPYPQAVSILRDPKGPEDEERIHFLVFDLMETDGKDWFKTSYSDRVAEITKLFTGSKIYPAFVHKGSPDLLDSMWADVNANKGFEGIFLTILGPDFEAESRIKIRPQFPQDLVVIAVQPSEAHEGWMGALVLAYMDVDGSFRYAGKVGTGFTQKDREEWLDWAETNQVIGPEEEYIWVKPSRVVEVRSDAVNMSSQPGYNFTKSKYMQLGEGLSAIGRKPVFIRIREDKEVTPEDLRLEQIPGFKKEGSLKRSAEAIVIPARFSKTISQLTDIANRNGYVLYAVGGFVRDILLGREPKDLDILVSRKEKE